MTPAAFRNWRLRNDLTQTVAAELLGYSPRQIRYYEAGIDQLGNETVIPRAVRLACWAIENGIEDWDGHAD